MAGFSVRAGSLNRRLHLQKVAMTPDSEGVSSEAWTDVDLVWAHVSPVGAQELVAAAESEVRITHDVTIRWRKDVTAKMRFFYGETSHGPGGALENVRIFLIHSLLDQDEAHRELDCKCEEIVTSQMGAT